MSTVRVSVIIPAYNAERWLVTAIRSVLEQLPELEVIVVNDGSTDGTSAAARSMDDPRVVVIDKANGGVSSARNAGLDAARGAFIAFLDADDAMAPGNLLTKLRTLESTGVDWVFADLQPCDPDLRPTGPVMVGTQGDVLRTILSGTGTAVPAPCSNFLARRKCFDGGLRFDERLSNAADQDIALGLARSFSYRHIPGALTLYRVLPGSMSKNIALYQKDHLLLFSKAGSNGLLSDPAFKRMCMANAYWAIGGSWWVNAGNKAKALPFLLRAILLRPQLLVRPFRAKRPS